MPPISYPRRAAFADPSWHYDPDSEPTAIDLEIKDLIAGFKSRPRQIAIDYYLVGLSMAEVAIHNRLTKGGIQWRIDSIRYKVLKILKAEL